MIALALVAVALVPAAPAGAAVNGVSEYEVPTVNPGSIGITAGPDGAMWFLESLANKVGRVTTTGEVTEYPLPTAGSQPQDIVSGPDGNLWFTEYGNSAIGRMTPSGELTEFPTPTAGSGPFGIAVGPDGNLWFTEFQNSTVARITTAGVITEFQPGGCSERPTGITSGPGGKLWFTAHGCNSMMNSIATDGTPGTEFNFPNFAEPYDIAPGPDGNLWVPEYYNGKIARITPDGVLTEFDPPTADTHPLSITVGPDGYLWFTENTGGRVGRMGTDGVAIEYSLPISSSEPYTISTGVDNRIWFSQYKVSYIGALDPATAAPVPAVQQVAPGRGPAGGGTSVVITGVGFTGTTQVNFNYSDYISIAAAGFTVDSDAQITAVTPPLYPLEWNVSVVSPGGTSAVSAGDRFVAVNPLAVSELSRSTGSPLGGTEVRVFGGGFNGATEVNFGGVPGTGLVVGGDGDLTVTAPAGANHSTVDVTVTTPDGTSAVVPEGRFTFQYVPVPRVIVPDSAPAAGGTSVVITGEEFLGVTGVTFGDTTVPCPAQCTVNGSGEILLVVPPHAVAGVKVTVNSPDGPSAAGPMFAYTGVGSFTPANSCVPDCAESGAVALPNGKVLAVSGLTYPNAPIEANIYDPATNVWTVGAVCDGCDSDRVGTSLTVLPTGPASVCGTNCGKVLDIGFNYAALYDPVANTWTPTGAMVNKGFSYGTATLLKNGKVLDVRDKVAQLYDPLTNSFTATGGLNDQRNSHAASLLNDGRVLVTGGGGQTGPRPFSNLAEVYDPASGVWTRTAPMSQARFSHTSTTLTDGRVLVTGGQIGFSAPITSSELWNPATGTWSPTANMTFARSDHAANLLPDGRVLVLGGDEPYQDPVTRDRLGHNPTMGEVYDPATQEWLPAAPAGLSLDDNNIFGQSHNVRTLVLPPGPASACNTNCGKVMALRTYDSGAPVYIPTAVLFAVPPKATLAPTAGTTEGGTSVTLNGTGLASTTSVSFGGVPAASFTPDPTTPDTKVVAVAPAHSPGAVDVTVTTAGGAATTGRFTFQAPPAPAPAPAAPAAAAPTTPPAATTSPVVLSTTLSPQGYALVGGDGGVFNFGTLPLVGSLGGLKPNQPIVAIEHTPTGKGYWLVGADGGVFAFGDAVFRGSTGGIRLAKPIVAMRSTPSGKGYWLVGSDGGVFAFGDAAFRGSTGAIKLNSPIVGVERSASGNGYWLVGSDGGVFAFGDAPFRGSTGALRLAQPIVSVARSATGSGYWLTGADGGVFAFGDAAFLGSAGGLRLGSPVVGMAPTATGNGYWLCARDGGVFAFGGASFLGSLAGLRPAQPVAGCAAPRQAAVT